MIGDPWFLTAHVPRRAQVRHDRPAEEPSARLDPGEDPAAIYDALPWSHREQFRAEYDQALDAAHDLARFKQVQPLLRQWRLRAIAYSRPGLEEAVQDALQGREDAFVRYTPPGWGGRVRPTASKGRALYELPDPVAPTVVREAPCEDREGPLSWEPARGLEPLTFCLQARSATSRRVPTCPLTSAATSRTSTRIQDHPTSLLAPPLAPTPVPEGAPARTARRCDRRIRAGVPSGPRGGGWGLRSPRFGHVQPAEPNSAPIPCLPSLATA
ncbi:DUF6247 family protein [Actinomadura physcomitrii]|uniref:DUF6247 family protein n=1 Tax=Actinomadura physcomitrii TaxID=2650748 RepID=UPI0038B2350E